MVCRYSTVLGRNNTVSDSVLQ